MVRLWGRSSPQPRAHTRHSKEPGQHAHLQEARDIVLEQLSAALREVKLRVQTRVASHGNHRIFY